MSFYGMNTQNKKSGSKKKTEKKPEVLNEYNEKSIENINYRRNFIMRKNIAEKHN